MKPAVVVAMIRRFRVQWRLIAGLAAIATSAAAQAEGVDSFSVPMVQQQSGAFYVRGTLGESVAADFLVDTGSSYVVLSPKTFDALKQASVTTYLRTIRGATANGRKLRAKVYSVSTLAIGDGCVLESVEVVVLPGSDRDILGLSALKRVQPFTFDLEPLALKFEACRPPANEGAAETA